MKDEKLTYAQCAEEAGVSISTVRKWVKRKKLSAIVYSKTLVRIKKSNLLRVMDEMSTEAIS